MRTIDFYFDPISPYAWLAWTQLEQVEQRNGVKFRYVPVLLAGFLDAIGTKGPAEIAKKREYTMRDAMRWAVAYGKPFEGPPTHPFNPLKALRLCVAITDDAERSRFAGALMHGIWSKGYDPNSDRVLVDLASDCELDGQGLLAKTEDPAVKEQLKKNTQEALDRGVFGVPTFAVGNELFWGNDRIGMLELHLRSRVPLDETLFKKVLARPASVTRKV